MADTLGSMIDKICTINQKMYLTQSEFLDNLSFDDFKNNYASTDDGLKKIFDCFKKTADLDLQLKGLLSEFDCKVEEIIESSLGGNDLDDGKFVQRQHKTY
jgi:hypothetical protein